jgi:hypothetical protein
VQTLRERGKQVEERVEDGCSEELTLELRVKEKVQVI